MSEYGNSQKPRLIFTFEEKLFVFDIIMWESQICESSRLFEIKNNVIKSEGQKTGDVWLF